jgi:hypothetical protein
VHPPAVVHLPVAKSRAPTGEERASLVARWETAQ